MKLVTKEVEKALEANPLYSHENDAPENVPVLVKFFNAFGAGSWFATEARKEENGDWLFFGYVTGLGFDELGYFRLSELSSVKFHGCPAIERDLYFGPATLAQVMEGAVR